MTESPSDVKLAVALRLKNPELAPIAFLFESYEPAYWWFECLVCIERLFLMNANIYLSSQPVLQPFVVLMIALVSVKLYSLLDPYMLDSDDLFAEMKHWAIVAMVIFTIILQVHDALEIELPMGITVMLITILLTVFGVLSYFCLATIVTEISFFRNMATRMFPDTSGYIERRFSSFLTREGETEAVEAQAVLTVEDATGDDDENKRNTIGTNTEEMADTEDEHLKESVQAANESGCAFLDEPVSEYGLELSWDMEKNMPCALFKQHSGS
eukprot:CAMPEP_0185751712 /NCGR_PEP_ID=MMETSP1174-20130828/10484_1 /TAXON_ID=35687 /ORGANISM="Dictyocha speculum, Strain CCMP1381" /LENGTH=269 /DNA_ID=CAMNT_0028428811 /DNA_START=835 /DNA_END=1644 /DNA_ORIENTATION=-